MTRLADPRSSHASLFMRLSGAVLLLLVFSHVFIVLIWDDGVYRIDFNYVAQRWNSPLWRISDLIMLWLAQLHGGNGMRTIIDDYARKDSTRFLLNGLLAVSVILVLAIGSYTLIMFNPAIS